MALFSINGLLPKRCFCLFLNLRRKIYKAVSPCLTLSNTVKQPVQEQSGNEQTQAATNENLPDIHKQRVEISKFERYEKIPTNKPFVKNLFLGEYDKEMLAFPDFSNNEELKTLDNFVQVLEMVFKDRVDSSKIDKDGKISPEILDLFKPFGMFGLQVPQRYGGLDLTATKYTRLSEVIGQDASIAITLAAHQAFALYSLVNYASDNQKEHYLPSLAAGQTMAAFCLTEPNSGSDISSIESTATLSDDGSKYYINGHKIWVVNGAIADVLIVFAKTLVTNDEGEKKPKLSAFIVERGHGGVTSSPCASRFGVRGADIGDVTFENVAVPIENMLGSPGEGFKIAMNTINSGRYSMGGFASGLLKKLINECIDHVISKKQFGKTLQHYTSIKDKLGRLCMNAYAMESVSYLTTLTLDKYQDPDISVEAAIVKVFCSECLWSSLNIITDIFGASGLSSDLHYERHLRDSRVNLMFEGANDILRLYISLTGLQHAGKESRDYIRKKRNPFDYPRLKFEEVFNQAFKKYEYPTPTLFLHEETHPSLHLAAKYLESSVLRFKFVVEELLTRHGNTIVDEQPILMRLSDVAISLYTMTACLSRASRAICIGLDNHDDQVRLANIFIYEHDREVYGLIEELFNGPNFNMDANRLLIADKMLKQRKYTPSHAIERNW